MVQPMGVFSRGLILIVFSSAIYSLGRKPVPGSLLRKSYGFLWKAGRQLSSAWLWHMSFKVKAEGTESGDNCPPDDTIRHQSSPQPVASPAVLGDC